MVGGPSLFQILELSLPILGTVIANKIWLKQKVKTKSIFPNQREMVNFGPKSKAYQGSIKLGKPTNVWVSFFYFPTDLTSKSSPFQCGWFLFALTWIDNQSW